MKQKYEISVWSDKYDSDLGHFVEQKEVIIGSDTMISESRAREPKLINNINGTNKFTFNMYYKYIDTQTGQEVENPYIKYLVNERKIKVLWKDEWYDLLIKQIKEDSVNRLFSYTCEDAYITELSRTGFELVFATEKANNIGTAQELVKQTIENTDWRFDQSSDKLYQETEEPVYDIQADLNFWATLDGQKDEDGKDKTIKIEAGKSLLVYYSCAPNIDNLTPHCQFYYNGHYNDWDHDVNDMLVVGGQCCSIDVQWTKSGHAVTAKNLNGQSLFKIDLTKNLSSDFRAKRLVDSQQTEYNDIVERYVNIYNNGTLLGYQTTDYNDALAVVNLITNPSNFKNLSGWVGENLSWKMSPPFGKDTQLTNYNAHSYFKLEAGKTYYNLGLQNNRSYIPKGFIEGEEYIFRIKARTGGNNNEPGDTEHGALWFASDRFTLSIKPRDDTSGSNKYFNIAYTGYVKEGDDYWVEYAADCIRSCSYEDLIKAPQPTIFISCNINCWLQEIQFFKEIWGVDGTGKSVRINPNNLDAQSVATPVWVYFNREQPEGTTAKSLKYIHTSITEWNQAIPDMNDFEKYATIEESQSNRFNILQSIAEKFECWIKLIVKHDPETGYITYSRETPDGPLLPDKYVKIVKEAGQETGIGFVYGIDLQGVVRNIKSDQISTKTIVAQNENEFGTNGFCSIARSEYNYPRENFIYNFDYYIQQGLLDAATVNYDFYGVDQYYDQLHNKNITYAKNLEDLINKKAEKTKQEAMLQVYEQYIQSAKEEQANVEDSIKKLADVDTIEAAELYLQNHGTNTKVATLLNDRAQIIDNRNEYEKLQNSLQSSLNTLNKYITNTEQEQSRTIDELTELNRLFYQKYSRFIQEGTWSSEDYYNDNLYYLDALQVAYTSARPQISYEINVLRISDIDDYNSKIFHLGDISFVQDVDYFGYKPDGITPYKEKVFLSEITSYFETPDKDTIKVQNYKTQFDDLFQRITAATQTLEFSEGKYARVADIVNSDGTIKSSVIQNTFDNNKDLVYGAQNESVTMDNTGITVSDNGNAAHLVKITSGGIFVSNDGGNSWKNAVRGDGISADVITTGRLNTELITIYSGETPSFIWDENGISAYRITNGATNYDQFVRFDKYGIYGIQGILDYIPTNEGDIYKKAKFGLTWNRFFMKSTTEVGTETRSVEISTDRDIVVSSGGVDRVTIGRIGGPTSQNYGIVVRNQDNEIIFQCDNDKNNKPRATLAGWQLTLDSLISPHEKNTAYVQISSNGSIGCYGSDESKTVKESAYNISLATSISATNLKNNNQTTINQKSLIYAFINDIGQTKITYEVGGTSQSHGDKYHTIPDFLKPTPLRTIQFVYQNINYKLSGVSWTIKQTDYTVKNKKRTYTVGEETATADYAIYTYYLTLTGKVDGSEIFSVASTKTETPLISTQSRYFPPVETPWYITKNGKAFFHNIEANGGQIAGWWINDTRIYQTYNGKSDLTRTVHGETVSNIRSELNSNGKGTVDGSNFDYSIITDAINAAMATIGGVLLSGGLVDGYRISEIAATANSALSTASEAKRKAKDVEDDLKNYVKKSTYNNHTHTVNTTTKSYPISGNANLKTGSVAGSTDSIKIPDGTTSSP